MFVNVEGTEILYSKYDNFSISKFIRYLNRHLFVVLNGTSYEASANLIILRHYC